MRPTSTVAAVIIPASPGHVTFNLVNADPNRSSVQMALEDAVETVQTDAIQPYCSPYIQHLLTTHGAQVSAIDIDVSQFVGPDGTLIDIPTDGPPLPDKNSLLSCRYWSNMRCHRPSGRTPLSHSYQSNLWNRLQRSPHYNQCYGLSGTRSCHALQDLGYEVQHALLTTGNLLKI
jgi:hypothetical protein